MHHRRGPVQLVGRPALLLAGVTLGLDCLIDAHDIEHDGPVSWRWTNGSARLLVPDSGQASVLEIDWAPGWLRYWQAGAREKGDWSE